MKRSKIFCLVISVIFTMLLQGIVSKVMTYDLSLLIVTSMMYFAIFLMFTDSIYGLLRKE